MNPPIGTPCRECPWRRVSCPGWLGPFTAEEWNALVHSDAEIACHLTITDDDQPESSMTTCSGAAIHRSNICKSPRGAPRSHALPADRELVFGHGEFISHHTLGRATNK